MSYFDLFPKKIFGILREHEILGINFCEKVYSREISTGFFIRKYVQEPHIQGNFVEELHVSELCQHYFSCGNLSKKHMSTKSFQMHIHQNICPHLNDFMMMVSLELN